MLNSRLLVLSVSFISLIGFSANAQAPALPAPSAPVAAPVAAAPSGGKPITREELPGLVREALINNPEMIKEAIQKLREKGEAEAKKKASEGLVKHKDEIFNDASAPTIGDAKSTDITVVEFFDYHCGYCRHMLPVVAQLLKEDPKVRFVFKEYPILSPDSVVAARAALAVNRIAKDKYFEFHTALMKLEGKFEEKSILAAAKKLGLSSEKLKAEMAKEEITAILDKNRALGNDLGISGTPSIIIGDEILPGAVSVEDLKKMIAAQRSGGGKKADAAEPKAAPVAPVPSKADNAAAKQQPVANAPAEPVPAPMAPAPVEQPKN